MKFNISKIAFLPILVLSAVTLTACSLLPSGGHSELGLDIKPSQLIPLEAHLEETSGLAMHRGLLWTHNDSGDKAKVYQLDSAGKQLKYVVIENGHNFDWEEMAQDKDYLYVADIGDNFAQREELVLYRLAWSDLRAAKNAAKVTATKMSIKVADKPAVTADKNKHNFDFEGLSHVNGELWLFSKNRADGNTSLYKVNKSLLSQSVSPVANYPVDFLLTAADYSDTRGEFALLGYQLGWAGMSSFLWRVKINTQGQGLDWSSAQRYNLNPDGQWEAVVWDREETNSIWLSREGNQQGNVVLSKVAI